MRRRGPPSDGAFGLLVQSRETLGSSERVWKNMTKTLMAGNDQLGQNKHHLLPKIWDLVLLGRNLLAAKEKAQNLAAYGCPPAHL